MTDPIADMITRIKNALMAGHAQIEFPHSKLKEAIAHILKSEGYIGEVKINPTTPQATIVVQLKYIDNNPAITGVKRLSKPGRRLYAPAKQLPKTLGGYGITIISTSKGVVTDKQARKQNIGGELLCQIW